MDATRPRVFVGTSSFAEYDALPLALLKDAGLDVRENPYRRRLTEKECLSLYQDTDGIIAGTEPITAEVLKSARNLRVISRCGVGTDNIDLEAAKSLGIRVFTTPDSPTVAVAELTVGLMLALLRHIPLSNSDIHAGRWQKRMGSLLRGKKVGIIGLGRIGRKVAGLVTGLGAEVIYTDVAVNRAEYPSVSLDELLSQADIVTLHLSGGGKGAPLLGAKELRSMKQGSRLINCARGGMVDEAALFQVLQEGWLSGAAVDVFEEEPYTGPLAGLDNVILTPHIGSYAMESRVDMEIQSVKNLLEGLKG
jgi:D-3-phosphoglycerate dehydrogenase